MFTTDTEPARNATNVAGIPPVLSVRQLGELLGYKACTIREWRRSGKLPPPVVIGQQIRWRGQDIARWLADRPSAGGR